MDWLRSFPPDPKTTTAADRLGSVINSHILLYRKKKYLRTTAIVVPSLHFSEGFVVELIAQFIQSCPMAAITISADGVIRNANLAATKLFEKDLSVGATIADLLPQWAMTQNGDCTVIACDALRCPCEMRIVPVPASEDRVAFFFPRQLDEMQTAARDADGRLRAMMEMLPHAVCVFDASDKYLLWNQRYAEIYSDIAPHLKTGLDFKEALQLSLSGHDIQETVVDEDQWLRDRIDRFHRPVSHQDHKLTDGRWFRYDDQRTPDGGAIGMRIDITEFKQREEWLLRLFDANPMPMLLCDGDSLEILQINDAAADFYGYAKGELIGKKACGMHDAQEAERFRVLLRTLDSDCPPKTIWRQRTSAAGIRHVLIHVRLLWELSKRRFLFTVADVSDNVRAEQMATYKANHDPLTGLLNRNGFTEALTVTLNIARAHDIFIHCLDLDGFKPVNDTFGHPVGDEVLKLVAQRLLKEAAGHTVARLGGDEFAIVQLGGKKDAEHLAERCVSSFAKPFCVDGRSIKIGVSVGLAGGDGLVDVDGAQLVRAADQALYAAKAAGRNTWRVSTAADRQVHSGSARARRDEAKTYHQHGMAIGQTE